MRNHIQLGSIAGVPIGLHSTVLWLLAIVALFSFGALPMIVVLAVAVLVHELGHALVAKRFGVQVHKITLYPFGGMAHMSMIPERGREELIIALAGPLTNLALALPFLIVLPFMGGVTPDLDGGGSGNPALVLLQFWTVVNVLLGLFNLLPAFPLDGGRVLRSMLVSRMGFLPATELAVKVGRFVAVGMFLFGIAIGQPFSFGLVALFVWFMGGRELFTARLRHATGGGPNPLEMFKQMFEQQGGAGFGGASFGGNPFGGQAPFGPSAPENDEPREAEFTQREGGGFSEEDVRRLEGFHGRLPRKPDKDGA